MGVDIEGWVEFRDRTWGAWHGVIRIERLVHRSYGMFASLFGVRNEGRFRPVAEGRGVPERWSDEFEAERRAYGGAVGTTWVLWSELASVDWDEEERERDLDPEDEPVGADSSVLYSARPMAPVGPVRRRRDYLIGGWATLFKMMELLADDYGADGVRLSVWFDSL